MLTSIELGRSRDSSRRLFIVASSADTESEDLTLYRKIGLSRKNFENVAEMRKLSNLLRDLSYNLKTRASRLARHEPISSLSEPDSKYMSMKSTIVDDDKEMKSEDNKDHNQISDEEVTDLRRDWG